MSAPQLFPPTEQEHAEHELAALLRTLKGDDLALYKATRQDNGGTLINLATPQQVETRAVIPPWRNRPYLPLIQPYPKFTDADYNQPPPPPITLDVLATVHLPPPDDYETLLTVAEATIPLKHSLHHLRRKWIYAKKEYPREPEPNPQFYIFRDTHHRKQQTTPYRVTRKIKGQRKQVVENIIRVWHKHPLPDCGHPSCVGQCLDHYLTHKADLHRCSPTCAAPADGGFLAGRTVDWDTGEISELK